ncbi:hypothetical protein [Sphingomonas sp. PB4P5]|uniref:hypothetical protein n=1 Tax=Parasphingomonas puruogangriensis TaxID=3096155 RepID=UPI002FC7D752
MTRHASFPLDDKHEFGREALTALQPLPNGGLGHATDGRQGGLRTRDGNCFAERFERSGHTSHNRSYDNGYSNVKCQSALSRYYQSNNVA